MDQLYDKPRYYIDSEDGTTTVLNASGQLDKIMSRIAFGDYVRVVFDGSSLIETGKYKGKQAYSFKVQVDPDRRKAVPVEPEAKVDYGAKFLAAF